MSQRVIEGIVGPVWFLCGLMMAAGPPLEEAGAAHRSGLGRHSPVFGGAIALAGAWMAIRGIRDSRTRQPR